MIDAEDKDLVKGGEEGSTEVETESQEQETNDEGAENENTEETESETEETGEEDSESTEETEQPEKPVKGSRAQERIRRQQEELKAERAEKEQLIAARATAEAQLEHFRQQQHNAQSEGQRQAEEQRLALLDPQERELYKTNQRMRELEFRLNQSEMRRQDDNDRAVFHAKAAHDPVYAKHADEIEATYQDGLKKGVSAPREDLLAWKLGKEFLKNKDTAAKNKKTAAGKRIETVTGKSTSAKSDVTGKRKGSSEEDRLRNVPL